MQGDILIKSTQDQVKDFIESLLWKDIKRELNIWIRIAKDELLALAVQCASADIPTETAARLASVGGRIEAISHMLQIPENFLIELEEQANARRKQTD